MLLFNRLCFTMGMLGLVSLTNTDTWNTDSQVGIAGVEAFWPSQWRLLSKNLQQQEVDGIFGSSAATRDLSLADGTTDDGVDDDETPATKDTATDDEDATPKKKASPYGVSAAVTSSGGGDGAAAETAPAPAPAKSSPTSGGNSTATAAVNGTVVDANGTVLVDGNATLSGNSTNGTSADDDDSPGGFSQWDITNNTDFDRQMLNQTEPTSTHPLLPAEAEQPESWPLVVLSVFVSFTVLMCAVTGVRHWRSNRKRKEYEIIQSIDV